MKFDDSWLIKGTILYHRALRGAVDRDHFGNQISLRREGAVICLFLLGDPPGNCLLGWWTLKDLSRAIECAVRVGNVLSSENYEDWEGLLKPFAKAMGMNLHPSW